MTDTKITVLSRIPLEVAEGLRKKAADDDRSISNYLERLIIADLKKK